MDKTKILKIVGILILVLSLPIALILVKQNQENRSHAASADQLEAENGTRVGNANIQSDSNASGGNYIVLGVNSGFGITAGPTVTNTTDTTATITWTLSEVATGQVEYGTTTSYGTPSTPENSFSYSTHIQTLQGLSSGTTYHYRVKSTNQAGTQVVSGDNTFTTTGSGGGPTPTNGPNPTPGGTSANGIYGMGIGMDGVGNTIVGFSDKVLVAYRFKAEQTSNITAVRWYDVTSATNTGYSKGNGGVIRVTLRADDGTSNHFPSGTVLGTAPDSTNNNNHDAGRLSVFNSPVPVVKGNWYHVHWENVASDPDNNYTSVNGADRDHPDSGQTQPKYPDNMNPQYLYKNGLNAQWAVRGQYTPIFDINYSNGAHQGQGYMESTYGSNTAVISGTSNMVRERFTVSGGNQTVTGASIRLVRASGSDPLLVRLEDTNGNLIDSFSINASNIVLDPSSPQGQNGRWASGTFGSSHTLVNGNTYNLRLSTGSGSSYYMYGIRKGSGYGYDSTTYFSDGIGQVYSGSWSDILTQSGSTGQIDIQFYFTAP